MLDLFSGIGGFSLGLERSGLARTVAFCEIDPYCQRVLKKHWTDVRCYDDVRNLTAARLAEDGIERPRIICGGFPCQDLSVAGRGAGLAGERSGFWFEFARIIGEFRPDLVFVENVSALLGRGLGTVLGDLASMGYDAIWGCIRADQFGLIQARDRLWIVAHNLQVGNKGLLEGIYLGAHEQGWQGGQAHLQSIADAPFERGDCYPQPLLRGMARRVPNRVDRVGAVGNAVVPQIPEMLGRAVMRAMA
jgi:DNA (cytosine-5)-methyltransferase 1